ncbi:hypothetical protein IHC87_17370 [Photobacterium damselae subsp. damselae]|uniref:hypothetical protein n=1 Tax=Photobacterium damselae TaxID=38293 RepID=UPI001F3E56AB|nr:hypothetical protein [Photobacterium damselae]UJZ96338.1 hypothetical protein IHC87_17370 [Photobacterium damselae subsp. damselae]UJZ99758.1 hypothetical protein IHC88_20125 [Photobacterium damselae subsp. damselae]
MGGGSNKVKETDAQRAAAEIAAKQWDIYDQDLKGFEDSFIQRVDALNSESNMANTQQGVDLNYASSFGNARKQASQHLTAQGIDPSGSRYQSVMDDLQSDQAISQADTINRAQIAEQDRHINGLSDVVAVGAGQKGEALAGMGDVANNSLRKSVADAQDAFNKKAANAQLAGTALGAGVRYGLKHLDPLGGSTTDGISTIKQVNNYDDINNPNGTMYS